MAEGEEVGSIFWSARIELGELEDDARKAQSIIDRLFERNANRTINIGATATGAGGTAPGVTDTAGALAAPEPITAGGGPGGARSPLAAPEPIYMAGAAGGRFAEPPTDPTGFASSGGAPSLQPPSSRTYDFGPSDPGRRSFARPYSPQEARGLTRADLFAPLPEAEVLGGEEGDFVDSSIALQEITPGRGGGRRGGGNLRFNRFLALGALTYEGLRLGSSFVREQEQLSLAAGNVPEQLAAKERFAQSIEGIPLFGQVGEIIGTPLANILGRQTIGQQRFGLTQAIGNEQADINRATGAGASALAREQLLDRASVTSTTGDFNREILSASLQADQQRQALFGREATFRAELGELNPETRRQLQTDLLNTSSDAQRQRILQRLGPVTDPAEWRRRRADFDTFETDFDQTIKAIDIDKDVTIGDVNRRRDLAEANIRGTFDSLREAGAGQLGRAANFEFEAGLNQQQRNWQAAGISQQVINDSISLQRGVRVEQQGEDRRRTGEETQSLNFELARQPLDAELENIRSRRRRDIRTADPGSIDIINEHYDRVADRARQRFADQRQDIGISQSTTAAVLEASRRGFGREPDPVAVRAIEIAGETQQEANRLARAGFTVEARRAIGLGIRRIQVSEEEYEDQIRAQQIDPNRIDFGSRRNRLRRDLNDLNVAIDPLRNQSPGGAGQAPGPFGFNGSGGAPVAVSAADKNSLFGMSKTEYFSSLAQAILSAVAT